LGLNGARDVQVVEPPDAIKCVLVRWNGVKIDLTKLAKLRWIEKRPVPEICQAVGLRRTAVRASIRTIRKCGLSELNLTEVEINIIQDQMKREQADYIKFGGKFPC
jgi:predicted transcriptional regulator